MVDSSDLNEVRKTLELQGLGYIPKDHEWKSFEEFQESLGVELKNFEDAFAATRTQKGRVETVNGYLRSLEQQYKRIANSILQQDDLANNPGTFIRPFGIEDADDIKIRQYVQGFLADATNETLLATQGRMVQRLRRQVAKVYVPEAEKAVEKPQIVMKTGTDVWSPDVMKTREDRIGGLVENASLKTLESSRVTVIETSLRRALAELKKRARAQDELIDGKMYSHKFMQEQKPLIDHIKILHLHYKLAGEKIEELKNAPVEEIIIHGIPGHELDENPESKTELVSLRPVEPTLVKQEPDHEENERRWRPEVMNLVEKIIKTNVENPESTDLAKLRSIKIIPAIDNSHRELERRAWAAKARKNDDGVYPAEFLKTEGRLVTHIATLEDLDRKAAAILNYPPHQYGADVKRPLADKGAANDSPQLRLATSDGQRVERTKPVVPAKLQTQSWLRRVREHAVMAVSTLVVAGSLGVAAVVAALTGGTASPATAAVSTPKIAPIFQQAAQPAPEFSKVSLVMQQPEPQPDIISETIAPVERSKVPAAKKLTLKPTFTAGSGETSSEPSQPKPPVVTDMAETSEQETPWAERPGVKEALTALDERNRFMLDLEAEALSTLDERAAEKGKSESTTATGEIVVPVLMPSPM
ncbi:MAG TPA: hypothetical protein PKI93_04860 [Alphaproteobacteria bacterium]|nr:hypothetical protein [Alphaproteobacteria bacterium]HNS44537.1 hypothetical protein [Alphaproteobacteria bacterium]